MKFEFVALNLTGFLFYSFYNSASYFYPSDPYDIGTVEIQDICFAYNAVAATIVTIIQAFKYPVFIQ